MVVGFNIKILFMVFCNYLHKDDIHKRNHTKLTQDILKQFDIIKNIAK